MLNDHQLFWLMGLWYHWVFPVLMLVMVFCFIMAGIQKVFPPKGEPRKKEDH